MFGFEVGVAVGEGADDEEVAIAKVLGEAGELPAQNHHVGVAKARVSLSGGASVSSGEFGSRRLSIS